MENYTRRAVLAAVGTGAAMGAGVGVSGASSHVEREDAVRIVHLSPDAPAVDVYANGDLAFENVKPLTQSGYVSYRPRSYTFSFTPAGEDPQEAIFETDVSLDSGEYTLAAIGEVCSMSDRPLELVSLEDDNGPTEAGTARLRGVHASPDAPPIDVVSDDGTVLFEEFEFGEAAYTSISAGKRVIGVRGAGAEESLARFRIGPKAGRVYTAFSVGYLNPEEAPSDAPEDFSFSLGLIEDAAPGER